MEINSLRKNIREREREERTYLALHLFEDGEERLFGGFSVNRMDRLGQCSATQLLVLIGFYRINLGFTCLLFL